jgi:hypothetical protein
MPSIESFRDRDPLSERVMNQILLGVSTRGYEASLEPRPREEPVPSPSGVRLAASKRLNKALHLTVEPPSIK